MNCRVYQSDSVCGEWNSYCIDGTGRCNDGIYDRSYDGMYGYHCKGRWMYASSDREECRA